jgi:membrane protein implicated in regulation of membrane protease activity
METKGAVGAERTRRVWLLFFAAIAAAVLLAVWMSARRAGSMSTAAASDEQNFAQEEAGAKAKLVIEIAEVTGDGTIRGKVLQKKTETTYARTGTSVTVHSNDGTKVVMGKQSDIHSGAVVHVTGTVGKDHSIAAEQIVILTGYVHVQ